MFVLTTVVDTVRIPPPLFAQPTLVSVHSEMDKKYPNRVLMDVGLAICRYGDALEVGAGVCVAGDGGAHHEVVVRLVVFRPFVEEVCVGTIVKSTEEGIRVSLGFFDDIFIPAYWMLSPSHYEKESGLWIWTPDYGDDEDGDDDDDEEGDGEEKGGGEEENGETPAVKMEENSSGEQNGTTSNDDDDQEEGGDKGENENRFEMEIGSEIRFKVKSINFTQVTNTAKGLQATTTTTSHSKSYPSLSAPSSEKRRPSVGSEAEAPERPVRKRSSSVDLSDSSKIPASMHIVASICEDGLGLTSWWANPPEEDEDDENEEEGAEAAAKDEDQ